MSIQTGNALRLDAIVLAAGAGSRFGGGKLLAAWGEHRLLDAALTTALAAPVQSVSVVWGADRRVPAAVEAFCTRAGAADRVRLVHAQRHGEGMAASLMAGVASLDPTSDGVFVFLGDMPRVPAQVLGALADAVAAGAPAAAPRFAGQRGHPVLFSAALYPALLALTGDRGAASVLATLGDDLALVDADDDGVLLDVDVPADLDRLARQD